MAIRRVHQKIERTPEQLAELKATRERFQREKPTHDDMANSGEFDGPYLHGNVMAYLSAIAKLKQRRQELGLSLAAVADHSGLGVGMLSRLENGKILNPTLASLWRYAGALGMSIGLEVTTATSV